MEAPLCLICSTRHWSTQPHAGSSKVKAGKTKKRAKGK